MTTENATHNEIQYIDIQCESVMEKHLREELRIANAHLLACREELRAANLPESKE